MTTRTMAAALGKSGFRLLLSLLLLSWMAGVPAGASAPRSLAEAAGAPALADHLGKEALPAALSAKPGVSRSDPKPAGNDPVAGLPATASAVLAVVWTEVAASRPAAVPVPSVALVRGSRVPTGPPPAHAS